MNLAQALTPTYILDVQAHRPKHWIVIGTGGTGGYLIPNLVRQISLQNKILSLAGRTQHKVTFIDADVVEDKNLVRQNFLVRDVTRNKAEVMATRYGNAFGVAITFLPEYMESDEMLEGIVRDGGMSPVFVDCVDNNKTREIIHRVFKKTKGAFSLSSGNEEWAGQVVVGYNAGRPPEQGNRSPHVFDLPSVADLYPEILNGEDKLPTELSCAEAAVSNPQNIQTNQTAANLMMGFANTILTADASKGEGLKAHQVVFNVSAPSFNTTLNKYENLVRETPAAEEAAEAPKVEVKVTKAPKKKTVETESVSF